MRKEEFARTSGSCVSALIDVLESFTSWTLGSVCLSCAMLEEPNREPQEHCRNMIGMYLPGSLCSCSYTTFLGFPFSGPPYSPFGFFMGSGGVRNHFKSHTPSHVSWTPQGHRCLSCPGTSYISKAYFAASHK